MEYIVIVFYLTTRGAIAADAFPLAKDLTTCQTGQGQAVQLVVERHRLTPERFLGVVCTSQANA
jgi:hypothetical protein